MGPLAAGSSGAFAEEGPMVTTTTASALRVAQGTFDLLTAEPSPLHLDGRRFGADLPAGPIGLGELRSLLLRPATSMATRDAVWRGGGPPGPGGPAPRGGWG